MTIFVTPRFDFLTDRNELRVGLDAALLKLLTIFDRDVEILNPFNLGNYIENRKIWSGVLVLSGGPDIGFFPDRDAFESTLVQIFENSNLKIIGICRGFQVLNWLEGGSFVVRDAHVNTRHQISFSDRDFGIRDVNSYHRNVITIDTLSNSFEILADSFDGSVECAISSDKQKLGIMWHPEREPEFHVGDLILFEKFLKGEIK